MQCSIDRQVCASTGRSSRRELGVPARSLLRTSLCTPTALSEHGATFAPGRSLSLCWSLIADAVRFLLRLQELLGGHQSRSLVALEVAWGVDG